MKNRIKRYSGILLALVLLGAFSLVGCTAIDGDFFTETEGIVAENASGSGTEADKIVAGAPAETESQVKDKESQESFDEKTLKPETESEPKTETESENESEGETETESETDEMESLTFRNEILLDEHFDKHGQEFPYDTKEEYVAGANKMLKNPDKLHKKEAEDGDDVYYLEETNEFIIVSKDGYIRTYFKPSRGIKYYNSK